MKWRFSFLDLKSSTISHNNFCHFSRSTHFVSCLATYLKMRIILTHEQADFDAIASLLAAHLLDDGALPVLPRRLNRNVQAFLTLYGVDLPFVDPRDLPSEPVEAVTLVDTQSMVSIKGMGSQTRVRVIDHHPAKENLPLDWSINSITLGATTTLLVEALRDLNGNLSLVQATLLLLGIYEDTGSLTYTRTTPRDLRAAAFLMEQGASLQIASNFLNHPLSQRQQQLYDELRRNAKHVHIHGHTIIMACGDAQDMDEELSSIAHKLRDLLDPDALFVLVTTRSGVQIIARSTTDNIDVAEIAANFGGGGHERAAAGLIRSQDRESVLARLEYLLPGYVRPALTVLQIMSRGPQVLTPETSAEEAANRMRRYGYEGYPVVQTIRSKEAARTDGEVMPRQRVLGLLTRRAVDRALAHKLNLPAASLMEAGDYAVQPGDSIEHLQRVMTDSGWGQVPVVHPETKEIIGIVTRTDLLKILTPEPRLPSRQNLAARLEYVLPPGKLALLKAVAETAHSQNAALYIVGGFVRDLLLERPSLDFDLVVEGDAIALAKALADEYGGRITSHSRFGTAKWHIKTPPNPGRMASKAKGWMLAEDLPDSLDLITARTEFYTHPTALPTVERGSIKLDLHRRDFTINTLALRLDGRHYGELHDYWGGLNDLRNRLVRVLHSLSFVDDPTRMLRAVRFEQRFDFRIEERTLELLSEARSLLDRVSGDRIRHEINHILAEERTPHILSRLAELELLSTIHPDLKWDNWLHSRVEALAVKVPDRDWGLRMNGMGQHLKIELGYILWLLRLPPEQARDIQARLKLSAKLAEAVQEACKLWQDMSGLVGVSPSQAVERLEGVPAKARYAVYLATSDIHLRKIIQTYVTQWQKMIPYTTGHTLRARGLPPGPIYRHILGYLRRAWLDGEIHNEEEEKVFLEKLLREM